MSVLLIETKALIKVLLGCLCLLRLVLHNEVNRPRCSWTLQMENSTLKLVADTNNCASLLKQSLVSYIIQCVSIERHHVIFQCC